jgi:predicted RNA binding protein YcfA (HicA-like mRNA interferase family)
VGRRITPTHYRKQVRIFELDGWVIDRQKGSHIIMRKADFARRVVIPQRRSVPLYVIENNRRTAKMSRERYFELLGKV